MLEVFGDKEKVSLCWESTEPSVHRSSNAVVTVK